MESDSANIVTEDEITVEQQMELEDIKTKIKRIKHSPHYNKSIEALSTVYDVPPSATIQELKDPSLETFISKGGVAPVTPDSSTSNDSSLTTESFSGEKEGFQNINKTAKYLQKLTKTKHWTNAVNDMIKPMYNNDTKDNLKKDGKWVRKFFEHIMMIIVSVVMSYNIYYFVFMYDWNKSSMFYDPKNGGVYMDEDKYGIPAKMFNLVYNDAKTPIFYCSYIFTWFFPMFFDFLRITRYRRICYLFILLVSMCIVFVGSGSFLKYIQGLIMGNIGPFVPIMVLFSAMSRILFGTVVTSSGTSDCNTDDDDISTNQPNPDPTDDQLTPTVGRVTNLFKSAKVILEKNTNITTLQNQINQVSHFAQIAIRPVSFIMQSILAILWALLVGTILALLGMLWFTIYVGSGIGAMISLGTLWPFTKIRDHIDPIKRKNYDANLNVYSGDIVKDKNGNKTKLPGINERFSCKNTVQDDFYDSVNDSKMFLTWFEKCWLRTIFLIFMLLKGCSIFHYIKNAHVAIIFILICFSIAGLLSFSLAWDLRKYIFKMFSKKEDKPLDANASNTPQLLNPQNEPYYTPLVYSSNEQKSNESNTSQTQPNQTQK